MIQEQATIPGWRVGPVLGEGRLGVVYRCHRGDDPRAYALKVVYTHDAGIRARFAAEIDALRRLDHPNVATLRDSGFGDGLAWLVMDLAPGRTLSSLRQAPGVPPAVALGWVRTLAEALAHAHARGVAHRDVKPANVIVDERGHLVLVDFGVVLLDDASRHTIEGRRPGTPAYAPLEWFGDGEIDAEAADVYALGVVAWELVMGAPAFPRVGLEALAALKQAPLRVPVASDDPAAGALADVVATLTAPDRRARPAAEALAARLAPWPSLPPPGRDTVATTPPEPPTTLGGHTGAPGPRIGRYVVRRELGRGGMGVVYHAHDPVLSREVAIKRLFSTTEASRERFAREARSVARLDHPGVIRVLDFGVDAVGPYFAMTYVDGPDLASVLAKGPVPATRALAWAIAVADALVAAHGAGIVHRDVKPGNILLDGGEHPRLGDFGLAVLADETRLTRADAVLGTPAYMAPEQAAGGVVDARADVYALGVVLFEMITGRTPFEGPSAAQQHQRLTEDAPPLPGPAPLARVVAAALARERVDRYPSMTAFLADLVRVRDGRDPEARGPGWTRRIARAARRPAARAAAVIAAAGALAVGVPGVSAARAAWATAARERQADERRIGMEAAVGDALAAGDATTAAAAFRAFVDFPAWQDTSAVSAAWMAEARRIQAGPGRDPIDPRPDFHAAEAWAQAWATATTSATQEAALRGLGDALVAAGQLDAAGTVADLADQQGFGSAFDGLRAVRRGVGRTGASLTRPASADRLVDRLLRGTRLDLDPARLPAPVDLDGDGRLELLVQAADGGLERAAAGRWNGARSRLVGPHPPPCGQLLAARVPDVGAVVLSACLGADPRLFAVDDVGTRPLGEVTGAAARALVPGAAGRVYVSTDYPDRDLWLLREHPLRWEAELASASTSASNSTIAGFARLAEGTWLAAVGAYEDHDLRRFREGMDGRLELVARRRIGNALGAAPIRGPGGATWLAVAVSPAGEPAFTAEEPELGAGLYLFDADLRTRGTSLARPTCSSVVAADLDGDGTDEIVGGCQGAAGVFDVAADGTVSSAWIGGVSPIAAADADGDGDDEVIALVDEGGRAHLWLLGTGDAPLPPIPLPAPLPPPSDVDPALAVAWQRAEELVGVGLPDAAESRFEAIAALDPRGVTGARALARAAGLAGEHGEAALAADRWARAATSPAADVGILRAAADGAAAQHRFDEAIAASLRWEAAAGRPDPARAAWVAAAATPTWTATLGGPITAPWQVDEPLGVRPAAGVIGLRTTGSGPMLRLPLTATGDRWAVDVSLGVEDAELESYLDVALWRAGRPIATARIGGRGGSGGRFLSTDARTDGGPIAGTYQRMDSPTAVSMTLSAWQGALVVDLRAAVSGHGRAMAPAVDGPLELVIGGCCAGAGGSFRLTGVRLTGLTPREAPADALTRARGALAIGDDRAALAEPLVGLDGALVRAIAYERLGQTADAEHTLGPALRAATDDDAAAALAPALRVGPERLADVARRALGRRWPAVFEAALAGLVDGRPTSPDDLRAFLRLLGPLPPPTPGDADRYARLERQRARALRLSGLRERGLESARLAVAFADATAPDPAPWSPFGAATLAHRELAFHLVDVDPDAAVAELLAAIAASPAPEVVADRAATARELAPLRSRPGWAAVVAARQLAP